MENKKGNLHIVILVFLVLSLLITSIFTGYLMQKNAFHNYELKNIQEINSNKLLFEQNLYVVSKSAFVKTFREFSLGTTYDYMKNRRNTGEFYELHDLIESNFQNRFRENFLEILSSSNTIEKKLEPQYNSLKRGKFDVNYLNDTLKLNFTYISANEQGSVPESSFFSGVPFIGRFFKKEPFQHSIISLNYKTQMEIFLDFEKVSLESFYEIHSAKDICKNSLGSEEMKKCFERYLPNFVVEVENVSEYNSDPGKSFPFEIIPSPEDKLKLVTLKTKKYFVFENGLEQINLTFVPI